MMPALPNEVSSHAPRRSMSATFRPRDCNCSAVGDSDDAGAEHGHILPDHSLLPAMPAPIWATLPM